MAKTMKDANPANNSSRKRTSTGTKSVSTKEGFDPYVFHQHIIEHRIVMPETPTGLIGEKVVYSERFLKKYGDPSSLAPLPDCGYFIITKAIIDRHNNVQIAIYPYPAWRQVFSDGTHISLGNMVRYNPKE